jgi:hypothetical protein
VSDILPVYAWYSSVHAWYFIRSCLIFCKSVLNILSVHAWCLSITCLMFHLYMLDIFIYHVLDVYLSRTWYLSVHAWCFYLSVLDDFVHLRLMILSICAWFNPTMLDNLSSFFVSTGLIFCQSRFLSFEKKNFLNFTQRRNFFFF